MEKINEELRSKYAIQLYRSDDDVSS